jgi:hypothetical protein
MLSDEVRKELAEAPGNIGDRPSEGGEHIRRRIGVEGDEKDQERDTKPGENLLDHGGLLLWVRVTVSAGGTDGISFVARCERCDRIADSLPAGRAG